MGGRVPGRHRGKCRDSERRPCGQCQEGKGQQRLRRGEAGRTRRGAGTGSGGRTPGSLLRAVAGPRGANAWAPGRWSAFKGLLLGRLFLHALFILFCWFFQECLRLGPKLLHGHQVRPTGDPLRRRALPSASTCPSSGSALPDPQLIVNRPSGTRGRTSGCPASVGGSYRT